MLSTGIALVILIMLLTGNVLVNLIMLFPIIRLLADWRT
jgi:hypothetical protein